MAGVTGVILQPSYIPWRGYFDLIHRADVFVFYDDVQYDKHGWRNRNRIKTAHGPRWLTIPVFAKGNVEKNLLLRDVRMTPPATWAKKHAATLAQSYARAPFFADLEPTLRSFFERPPELLADFTIATTIELARLLGITKSRFVRSSELDLGPCDPRASAAAKRDPTTDRSLQTDRLVRILRHVGATAYVSGPSARGYLDERMLANAGIDLSYIEYDYPEYEQLYPPYEPSVSVLDLMLMKGPAAAELIWGRS